MTAETRRGAHGARTSAESGTRTSKSAATRARILDAAASVLRQRGYASTRLSDIAEVADIQPPALYYYYKSRDELIEEVIVLGQQRVAEKVSAALEACRHAAPLQRIACAARGQLEVTLRDSDFASASIRNLGQLPADIRERQLVEQRAYGDVWRGLIADAADAGDLNTALDPRAARMFVLGALNWAPEWWSEERGALEDAITTAQTIIVNGLKHPDVPRFNLR